MHAGRTCGNILYDMSPAVHSDIQNALQWPSPDRRVLHQVDEGGRG